jgi:nitronate monooxygenase
MHIDRRFQDLFGVELPIVLAPMAGPVTSEIAIAVAEAGGLGSLPCTFLEEDQIRAELGIIGQRVSSPINVNFFCHRPSRFDAAREASWRRTLAPYYAELGLDPNAEAPSSDRKTFDDALCTLVEELRPAVVSFHFGLPDDALLARVKATGARLMSSATTVDEAKWLEDKGCDAIIAQGFEAGGHRGMFLSEDLNTQTGTIALVPQVVDAVSVPVIAAGGIADGRGIAAALMLGASAAQIGTAYLFCPEAKVPPVNRSALKGAGNRITTLTNVFTGRPARSIVNRIVREVGPMSDKAPDFPLAAGALAPLRAATEPKGLGDFMSLWSGQGAPLAVELPAGELTRRLWADASARLGAG